MSSFVLNKYRSSDIINTRFNYNVRAMCKIAEPLAGHRIVKISGYLNSFLALSEEGLVFAYGSNDYGQLGDGTYYGDFKQVRIPDNARIKDIACRNHSLMVSIAGELFGCVFNISHQVSQSDVPVITCIFRNIYSISFWYIISLQYKNSIFYINIIMIAFYQNIIICYYII